VGPVEDARRDASARRTSSVASRPRSRRARSLLGLGAGVSTVIVAAVLLFPSAAGLGVPPPVKHGPPFSGTAHLGQVIVSSGCGASASFVTPPEFNLTTGIGKVYGKSSVTACGPPGFSDFGATEGITGLDSASFVAHTPTPTYIWFNLTYKVTYNLSATPQKASGGPSAWASAVMDFYWRVWDLTTNSLALWSGALAAVTTNGTSTGNVSGTDIGSGEGLGGPLNFTAGHTYIVQIYAELFEFAYAPAGSGTHASARLNMATGAHQLKIHDYSYG
jgi:hypothetical protein